MSEASRRIASKRGLELVNLAPAVARERVSSLVAQESVFPTKGLAAHAVRLILLVLALVMAPKIMLASKTKATEVTLNVHWGVDKHALEDDTVMKMGSGIRRSGTNLTMDNTDRGHVRIRCRDAIGIVDGILGERP